MFFNKVTEEPEYYKLENIDVLSGSGKIATATVTMTIGEKEKIVEALVNVPGDSIFVKDSSKSFEESIEKVGSSLKRQLVKYKEKKRA